MNNSVKVLYDGLNNRDSINLHSSAFDTSIDIKDLETGEIIYKGLRNKVIIPGSGLIAHKLFDISTSEVTPSYNSDYGFGSAMYTPESEDMPDPARSGTTATADNHKVLLFACGIDGCGTEGSQVYPVDYRKWLAPENMVPFRYQVGTNDLSDELRETYFGRTLINNGEYIAYYFKRFEGLPVLVQQYVDGTPIDVNVYESDKQESAETYVELSLKITKDDIRDFFIVNAGIDSAKINTIELLTGYPVVDGNYMYYKEVRPLTKLNFPNEMFINPTKGIEIIYHIYM